MTIFRSDQTKFIRALTVWGQRVATSGTQTIWEGPTAHPYLPDAPTELSVVSGSANNSSGGTGARTMYMDLLDHEWKHSRQYVVLEGTAPVIVPGLYYRVLEARIATAGSYGAVQSSSVDVLGDGEVMDTIVPDATIDHGAFWSFGPMQYRWGILGWKCAIADTKQNTTVRFKIEAKEFGHPDNVWHDLEHSIDLDQDQRTYSVPVEPYTAREKDIVFDYRVVGNSSDTGTTLQAELTIVHDEPSIARYTDIFDNSR